MADPAPASAGRGWLRRLGASARARGLLGLWGLLLLLAVLALLAAMAGWAWRNATAQPPEVPAAEDAAAGQAARTAQATPAFSLLALGVNPADDPASASQDAVPAAPAASVPLDILLYRHRLDQADQGPKQAMAAVEALQECEDPEAAEREWDRVRGSRLPAALRQEARDTVERVRVLCPTLTPEDHARQRPLVLAAMRGGAPGGLFAAAGMMTPDDAPELRREVWDHLQRAVARCDGEALAAANLSLEFSTSMGMTEEQSADYLAAHLLLITRQSGQTRPTPEQEVASMRLTSEVSREAFLTMRRNQAQRAAALFKACEVAAAEGR